MGADCFIFGLLCVRSKAIVPPRLDGSSRVYFLDPKVQGRIVHRAQEFCAVQIFLLCRSIGVSALPVPPVPSAMS